MTETVFLTGTNTADPRLARRRSIRERIAERDILRSRRGEIESVIRSLDQELDAATNRHQAACQPIQEQIAIVEREQVNAMADRLPIPPALITRRKKLLDALNEENNLLEQAASDHKTRVAVLKKGFADLDVSLSRYADLTQYSLAAPGVANQSLLDQQWCSQQSIQYANARARNAKAEVEKYVDAIASEKNPGGDYPITTQNPSGRGPAIDQERVSVYENRLRRWRFEASIANKLLADAMAESNEIHKSILDE